MSLKLFRFITLMLAALAMGLSFCHLMEMPPRLGWGQSLWVESTVRGGLYAMFGTVGAAIAVGSVVTTLMLAAFVRRHSRPVVWLSATGAAFFTLSMAAWWGIVYPANMELAMWLDGPVSADWEMTRLRWETGHAIRAVLEIVGFAFLLTSILAEKSSVPAGRN